jgi:AAA+ ATPase superfamily predicted ATPase
VEFLDRTTELGRIRRIWDEVLRGQPRLVVLYGLRQVGKTFLMTHFLDDVSKGSSEARVVYFSALPGASDYQQLERFAAAVRNISDIGTPERIASWSDALAYLAAISAGQSLAVVLDEVPWLVDSDPTFPGAVQQFWDRVRTQAHSPRLFLVLTGSAIATVRRLLDASGALFGRADDEIHLRPFDLPTAAQALQACSPAEAVEAYAACGGYPRYLALWDPTESTQENLLRLMGTPGGPLVRSGDRLLADVPAEGGHRRVLHAVGTGSHRRSEIAAVAGQRADRPLDLLARTTLIRHRRPLGSPDRTPGRYEVADIHLRFWYEMVWADQELIEGGQGAQVLGRRLPRWQRHLGWVFEELAREHAVRLAAGGELPGEAIYGEWWATSGRQVQLDVVGVVGKRTVLAGEAKWTDRPLGLREYADLRSRAEAAPDPVRDLVSVFWNRGGLDPQLRSAGVKGYTPEEMVEP